MVQTLKLSNKNLKAKKYKVWYRVDYRIPSSVLSSLKLETFLALRSSFPEGGILNTLVMLMLKYYDFYSIGQWFSTLELRQPIKYEYENFGGPLYTY